MKKRMFKITALILSAVLLVTGTFYFTLAYLQAKSNPVVNTFTAGKIKLTLTETDVNEYGDKLYYATEYGEGEANIEIDPDTGVEKIVSNGDSTSYTDKENQTGYQTLQVLDNKYKLVPGETYVKDPVVTVVEGSESCFLYLAVHNGLNKIQKVDTGEYLGLEDESIQIAKQLADNGWVLLDTLQWNSGEKPDGRSFDIYVKHQGDNTTGGYVVDALDGSCVFETFSQFKVDELATSDEIDFLETDYNGEDISLVELNDEETLMCETVNTIEVYALAVQSIGFSNSNQGARDAWQATFGKQ